MLPYSPLHHLLLGDAGAPLVMTSGNLSDEPIAHRDDDALERLGGDRRPASCSTTAPSTRAPTTRWCARSPAGRPLAAAPLARLGARTRSPCPVPAERPLLACGAQLKSTSCLAKGRRAWVGHHIGDLEDWETLRAFRESARPPRAPVRGRRRRSSPTTCTRTTSPPRYALEREGVEPLARAAPPRPPRGLPGRARRARAGRRGDLRRHRLRHRRHDLGRRVPGRRPARTRAAPPTCGRCRMPGGDGGDPRALADGLRLAGRGGRRRPADPRRHRRPGGRRRPGRPWRGSPRSELLAGHDERGPPVRRRLGPLRPARRG